MMFAEEESSAGKDAPDTCYAYEQIIAKDQPDDTCMLEKWESLTARVEETQMATALHRELTALRTEFKAAHDRLFSYEIALEQPHILDERINRITAELAALRDRKAAMLALNVQTHRLITDVGNSSSLIFTALKDGVADLYRVWDETFQKGNQQLCALQAVQQFSIRLAELQCALRRDKDTLAVLDVALQAGATSEVASSVRHVARLLSEKQDMNCQNGGTVLKDSTTEEVSGGVSAKFGDSPPISLTQEGGSLSDSGISDSGSEQELSERERRLAALRRLTRSLESQLAPGSEALVELLKRVEDAETELRDLQKQCRELIVRTAASVEARAAKRTSNQVHHFVEYRDDALCWTDRKPTMDDVGNPTSVNARILELRKEKSRDAARSRRGKENFEFYELAKMLPLPAAITSQLDKASIIRLTISYLKLREFSGHGDPPWNRDGPPPNKSGKGANRVRSSASAAMDHFDVHQGTHILQSLDGFAMAVAADGRFLYISETVSIYLGLSQVEMTGSSVFDYVHQQDHAEVAEQLGLGLASNSSSGPHSSSSGLASPSSAASEEHGSSSTANPDVSSVMSLSANNLYKGYDRAFCVRMKSTLTKRGCHFKSSGYRVVLLLCRLRPQYTFSHTRKSAPPLIGMVGLAIALPPPSVHEIRLETDMFVTRINFDFRIAHCEPRVSELLDYTADELTGKNLYTLCHGEDANRLRKSHIDLIHKGQVLTHYYRLMNKSGGYTWLQTCATVVCNSKNAEEQNIICVNYVISGREYENLIMDCCQLEEGVMGVKREDAAGNDPENGSPDADRGEGRNHGGPPNQHQERPHRSPPEDREDTRGSESEKRGSRHHDNIAQLQQEPQTAVGNISTLVVKLRGHKRKLHEDDSSSNEEEDEEDDPTVKVTNNERSHALSPAPSNHSISGGEQVLCSASPKSRRVDDRTSNADSAGTSVKDLEQAMSKHLPVQNLNKSHSPTLHQPTDFSTDALLKQQQQRSTIQWIGAHHHLGHLSPQQSTTAPLPASALLRQLYANRESVIRANVHGITSSSTTRTSSSGGTYYAGDTAPSGPLPTPPGSEGSSTYGEHQFVLATHNQKSSTGTSCADAFTSLVSSYSTGSGYTVDYHSAMTPPSSVSPRDKQQQQQQQQLHPVNVISSYEGSSAYTDPVLRHQYEPAQPLPLKPQVYSAAVHPSALDAAAAYASAGLSEQAQFYHHPAAGAGFHIYHPTNKSTTNGWYSSTS